MDFFFFGGGGALDYPNEGRGKVRLWCVDACQNDLFSAKKILCGNATCGNLIHWIVTLIHSWVKMMNSGQ